MLRRTHCGLFAAVLLVAAQPAATLGWPSLQAGTTTLAGASDPQPAITAYVLRDVRVSAVVLRDAEIIATELFAGIGVAVRWRDWDSPTPVKITALSLEVRVEFDLPADFKPSEGALGCLHYRQPNTVMYVFYRRVERVYHPGATRVVLGYTIAHEMAHHLQGVTRHSTHGILKPFWTTEDFKAMILGKLRFAPEDVDLIRRHLAELASRSPTAKPAGSAPGKRRSQHPV